MTQGKFTANRIETGAVVWLTGDLDWAEDAGWPRPETEIAADVPPSGLPAFQMAGASPWRATFARPWAIAGLFWDAAI